MLTPSAFPAIPGWGWQRRAVVATTTVVAADRGYTIDATSGTYDIALTAAATLGAGFSFGVYNSGSGTVTINPDGAETIRSPAGSAAALALSQGQGVLVMCDGTGFDVVANATIPTSGTNTGDVTLTAVGAVPNANAASLAGQVLNLQPADGSFPGVITTGAQTIAGAKTLSAAPILSALTASRLTRTDASKALESNAALTATYLLYADSNGWPTTNAALSFSGTLLTITTPVSVTNATATTSASTGAVIVAGGIGCAGGGFFAGGVFADAVQMATASEFVVKNQSGTTLSSWNHGTGFFNHGFKMTVSTAVDSTSSTTGSLVVGDQTTAAANVGMGLGKLYVGTNAAVDTNSTAGNTRLMIYDVDNGTLERVSVGAADSGGAGFKLLRIPN